MERGRAPRSLWRRRVIIKRLLDLLDGATKAVSAVVLAVSVLVIFFQVIFRYGFNFTLPWTEELARYCNVWMTFLGIGLVSRMREHIRLDFLDYILKDKGKFVFLVFDSICSLVFFAFLGWEGWKMLGPLTRQISQGVMLPLMYIYLIIPIGCAILVIFTFETVVTKAAALGGKKVAS
jgi:TRAP-type C4-dicarboxylate transport system permease small subunit